MIQASHLCIITFQILQVKLVSTALTGTSKLKEYANFWYEMQLEI